MKSKIEVVVVLDGVRVDVSLPVEVQLYDAVEVPGHGNFQVYRRCWQGGKLYVGLRKGYWHESNDWKMGRVGMLG
jgi:hypothetical protein